MPTEDLLRWKHDGKLMKEQLEALGYAVDLEYAGSDSYLQIKQLEDMITNGAKVLIISAIDGEALRNVLDAAKEAGVKIIAYARLIIGSDAVSCYCAYSQWAVGQAQGQYIVDALDLEHADGSTYNIELFSGNRYDDSRLFFFEGAFSVLEPYIDNGTLIIRSGEINSEETSILYSETAYERMERILTEFYSDAEPLDAIYCVHDWLALEIEQALENSYHGSTYPIITGQECAIKSVKNILAGKQAMSAFCDTRDLAAATVEIADALIKGEEPPVNDTETYDNGTGIIPTYLVTPRIVTKDNYRELLIDTGYYTEEDLLNDKSNLSHRLPIVEW